MENRSNLRGKLGYDGTVANKGRKAMESSGSGGGLIGGLGLIVMLIVLLIVVIGMCKMFSKAGKPAWGAIIPVYNLILLVQIIGKPMWWVVLFFVPIVSVFVAVYLPFAIAKNFGKGMGFGVGLLLLPFIFYPILGFGSAEYIGPLD